MAWVSFLVENWTRADSATVGNGWIETSADWQIDTNRLKGIASGGSAYLSDYLTRPTGENKQDARIVFRTNGDSAGVSIQGLLLRKQTGNTYYFACINNGIFEIFSIIAGASTSLLSTVITGYTLAKVFEVDVAVTGASPTTITYVVRNITDGTTPLNSSLTNSGAGLQTSGQYGLMLRSAGTAYFGLTTLYQPDVLAAGVASNDKANTSPTQIQVTATDATGGSSPYTYQWQRIEHNATLSTTWVSLTNGGGVSGATTRTLTDGSAVVGKRYLYRLRYTDSASTVLYSNVIGGVLYAPALKVGFIGDSILAQNGQAGDGTPIETAVQAAARVLTMLRGLESYDSAYANVTATNRASSGTKSGDWTTGALVTNAISAMVTAGSTHCAVLLGINDAVMTATTEATYKSNISALCTLLLAAGITPLLFAPDWSSIVGGQKDEQSLWLLTVAYPRALDEIAAASGGTILRAGAMMYHDYISQTQAETYDGTHLTALGTRSLGTALAVGIWRAISPRGILRAAGMSGGMDG